MTIQETLRRGVATLQTARIDTPLLDASLLLADSLGITREKLFARMPGALSPFAEESFFSRIARRRTGVPVAYLTGRKEFFGLEFAVDERVLVPRPDTEILVEKALQILDADRKLTTVLDVCTGTGCIAIALKHERPDISVGGADISPDALSVFRKNARALVGIELPAWESDLCAAVPGSFDLITANPPYVESSYVARMLTAGCVEPTLALDGGPDGLDLVRRLVPQAAGRLKAGGWLLIEAGHDQAGKVAALLASRDFANVTTIPDLAGRNRVTIGQRSWKTDR